MKGQVTLPVIMTSFLILMFVFNLLPSLSVSISAAVPYLDAQSKVAAYLVPFIFIMGPALMALGWNRITNFLGIGQGGNGGGF